MRKVVVTDHCLVVVVSGYGAEMKDRRRKEVGREITQTSLSRERSVGKVVTPSGSQLQVQSVTVSDQPCTLVWSMMSEVYFNK